MGMSAEQDLTGVLVRRACGYAIKKYNTQNLKPLLRSDEINRYFSVKIP